MSQIKGETRTTENTEMIRTRDNVIFFFFSFRKEWIQMSQAQRGREESANLAKVTVVKESSAGRKISQGLFRGRDNGEQWRRRKRPGSR